MLVLKPVKQFLVQPLLMQEKTTSNFISKVIIFCHQVSACKKQKETQYVLASTHYSIFHY